MKTFYQINSAQELVDHKVVDGILSVGNWHHFHAAGCQKWLHSTPPAEGVPFTKCNVSCTRKTPGGIVVLVPDMFIYEKQE